MNQEEKDQLLRELHVYARAVAANAVQGRAKKVFDDYEKALVYSKLDGTKSDYQLAAITKVPRRTVTRWVEEFVNNGLAVESGKYEKAIFTLEELNVDSVSLKKEWEKKGAKSR